MRTRWIPGATDVDNSAEQSSPEVQVVLNSARMSDAGLDALTVSSTVQTAFLGVTTRNSYNVGNNDYNIRVQLQSPNRTNIDDVLLVVPSFYLLIDKFKNSYARKGEGI